LQRDAPEADVLRRVSESDDGMEDLVPDLIDYDQVREKSDKKYEFEDEEPQDENSIFKNKMDKIIADLDAQYPKEDEESEDKKSESEESEESEDRESIFKTEIDKIIADLDAEYPTFLFSEAETSAQQALDVLPLLVLPSKEHSVGSASSAR
jgi:hypothetical protein